MDTGTVRATRTNRTRAAMTQQSTPIVDFRSDNTGRASPALIAKLAAVNEGTAAGYGTDEWTALLQKRYSDVFETAVRVFPVSTGTAANALALGAICPSHGAIYCTEPSHISSSEANAAGFFSGGGRLTHVASTHAKMAPDALEKVIGSIVLGNAHYSQPAALSITQANEMGTVYSLAEIRALADVARRFKMKVHMDGARFANALARLGCTPAEMTWKSGVDILSFGSTKNGGLLADAIVVFVPEIADLLAFHLQRGGQVWSKGRFGAAQLLAYVENDLWMNNARAANAAGARIAAGVRGIPGAKLLAPIEANMVFLDLPGAVMDGLERDGIRFFRRTKSMARFVCRFDVTEAEVDALLASLKRHCGAVATAAQ